MTNSWDLPLSRWIGTRLGHLLPDEESHLKVTVGSIATLAIHVAGAGLSYFLEVLLARLLGAEEYGVYSFAYGWTLLLAIPASLGFSTALIRFVPTYATSSMSHLRGVCVRSWQLVIGAGVVIAAAVSLGIHFLGTVFSIPFAGAIVLGSCLVPIKAVEDIQASMGRGLGLVGLAFIPRRIVRPLGIGAVLLLVFFTGGSTALNSHVALLITGAVMLVVVAGQGSLIGLKLFSESPRAHVEFQTYEWIRVALPMLVISGSMLLLVRTDVLMLGFLSSSADVGTYNAASRTANLVTFVLAATNALGAPLIAKLYAQGEKAALQRLATFLVHVAFWPSLLIASALIVLAPLILSIFGAEFVDARTALTVLALANLVSVAVGSVGYFMNMTGNESEMMKVVGVTALLNILFNWLAIPKYGTVGAAVATAISIVIWNFWLCRRVISMVGVRPSILNALRNTGGDK